MLDENKIPILDIPDLTGCLLKPFVSYKAAKIDPEIIKNIHNLNDWRNPENFGRYQH